MNEHEQLTRRGLAEIEAGRPVALISVMSIQGSTPRREGTKMLVAADGTTSGTIGGSILEASAADRAKDVLVSGKPEIMSIELTGKEASDPAMICGGTATVLIDRIAPTGPDLELFRLWHGAAGRGAPFYLFTHLDRDRTRVLGHAIYLPEQDVFHGSSLSPDDLSDLKAELHTVSVTSLLPLRDTLVMVDRIRKMKSLYCFGAGHVALPTARLAALAGFSVVIIDDRPEFATPERFPEAREIIVADFKRSFDGLDIDADAFIVIVTRCHATDRVVLEQAVRTDAGYIGMICSRRKRDIIFADLEAKGVPRAVLEAVHSPIGLNIGAETPEEIAVSIIAELIQVRAERSG